MDTSRRPADDFLDIARALLLVQGSILVATTIEAVLWGMAFAGAAAAPFLLSAAAAVVILIARARLRGDRADTPARLRRRGNHARFFALDLVLAIALTGTPPPAVAMLTRFVLPVSVIFLLRQSARPTAALRGTTAVGGAS